MQVETLRMITDWLNDSAFGFNAKVSSLPVDDGDSARLKTSKFIADGSRDDRVWLGSDPPTTPALYLNIDGPLNAEGEIKTVYRDADSVSVAIRYITKNVDRAEQVTEAMYALRAIVRSIRELMRNDNEAARLRNEILIISCEKITYGLIEEQSGNAVAAGAVVASFKVRDKAP